MRPRTIARARPCRSPGREPSALHRYRAERHALRHHDDVAHRLQQGGAIARTWRAGRVRPTSARGRPSPGSEHRGARSTSIQNVSGLPQGLAAPIVGTLGVQRAERPSTAGWSFLATPGQAEGRKPDAVLHPVPICHTRSADLRAIGPVRRSGRTDARDARGHTGGRDPHRASEHRPRAWRLPRWTA